MFKKKAYDYDDPKNYLTDNQTIGTAEYYKKKIPNLPDHMYHILESSARIEYTQDDARQKFRELVFSIKKEQDDKLMKEYEDRVEEAAIEALNDKLKNNLDNSNNEQSNSSSE
jgi:hypothetical protein